MNTFIQVRQWLEGINPAAPWLALALSSFFACWAMRLWAPTYWAAIAKWGPEGSTIEHVTQAMPSVLGSAVIAAIGTGLDPWLAALGALSGLCAPLIHHAAKAYRGSPVKSLDGPTSRRVIAETIKDEFTKL